MPSWEVNSRSFDQYRPIPRFTWSLEPEVPLLCSQGTVTGPYPQPQLPPCFSKLYSNILPSMPMSSKWFLPFRFSDQKYVCVYHLLHASYTPHPLPFLNLISLTITGEKYKLWSSLCKFLQSSVTSCLSSSNILLSALFSNTLSLYWLLSWARWNVWYSFIKQLTN